MSYAILNATVVDGRRGEPYDSFKIISRKALDDYHKAEQKFLLFLQEADVWSKEQVRFR
jgi:hypothetical protein